MLGQIITAAAALTAFPAPLIPTLSPLARTILQVPSQTPVPPLISPFWRLPTVLTPEQVTFPSSGFSHTCYFSCFMSSAHFVTSDPLPGIHMLGPAQLTVHSLHREAPPVLCLRPESPRPHLKSRWVLMPMVLGATLLGAKASPWRPQVGCFSYSCPVSIGQLPPVPTAPSPGAVLGGGMGWGVNNVYSGALREAWLRAYLLPAMGSMLIPDCCPPQQQRQHSETWGSGTLGWALGASPEPLAGILIGMCLV